MPRFRSLFGRRNKPRPQHTEQDDSAVETSAEESLAAAIAVESAAVAPEEPAAAAPEIRAEVPLRALNAYRHDPAFNNFLRRMKRPPGTPERRPRGSADALADAQSDGEPQGRSG